MSDQTWVKLHRRALNNPVRLFDHTAWHVFTTLLLLVDRTTGEWHGGRGQLAGHTGLKAITAYKAAKRLEKLGMISIFSNSRFTTFRICKWHEYQESGNSTVTAEEQHGNTLTRRRSRKEITTTSLRSVVGSAPADHRNEDLQELMNYAGSLQFPLQGTQQWNRRNAWNLLGKYGLEAAKKLVAAAVQVRGKQYAPTINDFGALYKKCGDLAAYLKKQQGEGGKHAVIA